MTLKQTSALIDVQLFKDKILGIGSFGKVCRARYGSLPCAVKVIHETLFDPRASEKRPQKKKHRQPFKRFEQECEVLHNLRHPNIIQYLDVYQDPDTKLPVLPMELMDGSLTNFLEDSLQQISLHIQINFTHDIALALTFLHANKIVHRDLSSNNILLISNVRAKVTDFGMAMLQEATQSTRTVRPGTNVYMPPEAVQDNPSYTEKIDCFSLGVIIIQILTQCFPAPSDQQEELETLPGRLMQKGRKIMTTVPEVERRKNHIDLVQPNHPLLAIALNCLQDAESDRPSAQEICERVAALKENTEYTESAKGGDNEEKHHNVSNRGQEADSDEIGRLKELIRQKNETIAAKERKIEDLKKQIDDNTESPQQWEKPPQDIEGPKKEYSNYLTEDDFKEDYEMEQLGEFPEGVTAIKVQKPHQEEGHSKLEVLTDKPWYHGVQSRQEAEKRMGVMDMNTFLVRESVQDKGNLFLSVKNGDKCYHFPIIDHGSGLKRYEIHGTSVLFPSVPELVKYYQQHGLPESTDGKLIHLTRACSSGATPQPARPRKQHDYNSIDGGEDASNDDCDINQFKVQGDHTNVSDEPLSSPRPRLKAVAVYGRARAQFIPQKKHCTSQAPAEQVGPDDVHGLPTPASPDSAGHASTSSQKPGSNKSERFSVLEKTKVTKEQMYEFSSYEVLQPQSEQMYEFCSYEVLQPQSEQMYEFNYEVPQTQSKYYYETIYMAPATDEDALYHQLSQSRIKNIYRDSLRLIHSIGEGEFGVVYQGEWTTSKSGEKIDVAIKTLKETAAMEDKIKFLQEAAIMGQFSHPKVVKLYGVVTKGEPVMLIIELLHKGDLRQVLHGLRPETPGFNEIDTDLSSNLLSYTRQIASGMSYLSLKLFVHRDLAARNILMSIDDVCKIADFGMSRDLADEEYYISHGGRIPVKWTAPEALHYKKYSTASDVWSFGCVMYEIWSLGHKPFENITNVDCIQVIDSGSRLPPPPGCPRTIYSLMIDCWHPQASSRPNFMSLVRQLSLPNTKLLKWSEEDRTIGTEAAMLGAPLDKATELYKDLQEQYRAE